MDILKFKRDQYGVNNNNKNNTGYLKKNVWNWSEKIVKYLEDYIRFSWDVIYAGDEGEKQMLASGRLRTNGRLGPGVHQPHDISGHLAKESMLLDHSLLAYHPPPLKKSWSSFLLQKKIILWLIFLSSYFFISLSS